MEVQMFCGDDVGSSADWPSGFPKTTGFSQTTFGDMCGQDIEPKQPVDPYRAVRQFERQLRTINPSRK
jgi:hypothetical protein